jgi:hypothetical protein
MSFIVLHKTDSTVSDHSAADESCEVIDFDLTGGPGEKEHGGRSHGQNASTRYVFEFSSEFKVDDDAGTMEWSLEKMDRHEARDDDGTMSDVSDSVADTFCSADEVIAIMTEDAMETERLMREYASRSSFIVTDLDVSNGVQLIMSLARR